MSNPITPADLDALGKQITTHVDKQFGNLSKQVSELKHSLAGTDATVTALYAELVGNRPNLRDRLVTLETNVARLIELTPGADTSLKQSVYDV